MKKTSVLLATLGLVAVSIGATRAEAATYAPAETFYTAGSSAQFNTFGIAATSAIPGFSSGGLCGAHHWTWKSGAVPSGGSAISIDLVDPRSSSVPVEPANIWIAWDDNAANNVAGAGVVCFYASVDSVVGLRSYFARATLSISSNAVGVVGSNQIPLIGATDVALPQAIYNIVNGAVLNAANTDIRPEDGKFATMRGLTTLGTQVTGRGVTGLGYGPGPYGSAVKSSRSATIANVVDFAMVPGDTDPVNSSNPIREYIDVPIGAAPVVVIVNVSNSAAGHLGDGNYTNINRFMLAKVLQGKTNIIRDIGYQAAYPYFTESASPIPQATPPAEPLSVFIREPISGTYNTMEWSVPNSREIDADSWAVGVIGGQEYGANPSSGTPCTGGTSAGDCWTSASGSTLTTNSGNPLFQVASNGSIRARAIGTGEMVTSVFDVPDSLGYAFWGFSTFAGKTTLKYLTVDGVDPFFSGPSANPGGAGALPVCSASNVSVGACGNVPFTNIINGSYPIWSKYRLVYDPTVSSNIAPTVVNYAQHAAEPSTGVIQDFLPADDMQTFHSHYAQVVTDAGGAYSGNNGFKYQVPETGGDMGGAVLTIMSELDFIYDTNNQQTQQLQ